jgi:hypothetical protein
MAQYPANNFDIGVSQNYPFKTAPRWQTVYSTSHTIIKLNFFFTKIIKLSSIALNTGMIILTISSHTPESAPAGMLPADF